MSEANVSSQQLQNWFVKDALPLWGQQGYDHSHGGFFEALNFSGAPITGRPRRVRVQARQIYTFTQSALCGWGDEHEALGAKGFDYFLKYACPDNGLRGCAHILGEDGSILDNRRDLYDQAFLLLACASRWKAVRDDRALTLANATMAFLDTELLSPHGGWVENDLGDLPRRQNPHMHLFEAFMALYEVTQDQRYLDYADKIFALFSSFFYDHKNNILREFLASDLSPLDSMDGSITEPGHMVEWVWLLDRYAKISNNTPLTIWETLFNQANKLGSDKSNFLVDSVNLSENSMAQTRRLWPQTEYVKAAFVLARRDPATKNYTTLAENMIDRMSATYLNQPVAGLWCDQYTIAGDPIAANVPASILYHLFEATLSASNYLASTE